jgi:hypothetical protein
VTLSGALAQEEDAFLEVLAVVETEEEGGNTVVVHVCGCVSDAALKRS